MAETPQRNLKARILNVEPDPAHVGRTIVSVQFDDGDKVLGPWIQGFSLLPADRPLTPEEFTLMLREKTIERPVDPFKYLREAKDKTFDLPLGDI